MGSAKESASEQAGDRAPKSPLRRQPRNRKHTLLIGSVANIRGRHSLDYVTPTTIISRRRPTSSRTNQSAIGHWLGA